MTTTSSPVEPQTDDLATTLVAAWRAAAEAFVGEDPGRSVHLWGGGVGVGVADEVVRPGASVLKLPLAVAAFDLEADGHLDLDAPVARDAVPDSASPSILDVFEPERCFTTRELAGLALATSDNRSAEHLLAVVGAEQAARVARDLGCTATAVPVGFGDGVLNVRGRANVTTARDCNLLLRAVIERPHLAPVRTALATNLTTARIPARIPDVLVVAHKTGTLAGVVADVGIVEAPSGPLVACFLTDGQTDPAATAHDIAECTRLAYGAWEAAPRTVPGDGTFEGSSPCA